MVMSTEDWKAWLLHMKDTRGWSNHRCLMELGAGNNQAWRWAKNGPPPYIALACAAITHNLQPWSMAKVGNSNPRVAAE